MSILFITVWCKPLIHIPCDTVYSGLNLPAGDAMYSWDRIQKIEVCSALWPQLNHLTGFFFCFLKQEQCYALLTEMLKFMREKHGIKTKYCHTKQNEAVQKKQGNVCAIKILTPSARSGLNLLRCSCCSFSSGMGKYCFADKHCDVVNVQNLMKSIITDENEAFISL